MFVKKASKKKKINHSHSKRFSFTRNSVGRRGTGRDPGRLNLPPTRSRLFRISHHHNQNHTIPYSYTVSATPNFTMIGAVPAFLWTAFSLAELGDGFGMFMDMYLLGQSVICALMMRDFTAACCPSCCTHSLSILLLTYFVHNKLFRSGMDRILCHRFPSTERIGRFCFERSHWGCHW